MHKVVTKNDKSGKTFFISICGKWVIAVIKYTSIFAPNHRWIHLKLRIFLLVYLLVCACNFTKTNVQASLVLWQIILVIIIIQLKWMVYSSNYYTRSISRDPYSRENSFTDAKVGEKSVLPTFDNCLTEQEKKFNVHHKSSTWTIFLRKWTCKKHRSTLN